jgi:hypothetical protein
MDYGEKITDCLFELLNETEDKLSKNDISNIREYLEHDEWGLAYEILSDQLCEFDIPIRSDYYDRMESIGKLMKKDPSYCNERF